MKFFNLLKKEIRELMSKETIIGMIFTLVLLVAMGQIMGGFMSETMKSSQSLQLCDKDQTAFTAKLIEALNQNGYDIQLTDIPEGNIAESMAEKELDGLVILPKGFTKSLLEEKQPASLQCVNVIESTSMMGTLNGLKASDLAYDIAKCAKDLMLQESYLISDADLEFMESPVVSEDITVVGNSSAKVSPETILSFVSSQGMIVPLVIFVLAIMASQMIITAISTEKIDKTLETLLTAPVSRMSVLGAKMTAAALVALLNAVVYMIGFSFMMSGMTGNVMDEVSNLAGGETASATAALSQLGMILTPGNYVLLGLQMFMTLLITLAISLCLGAMVNDAKSTQTIILPMMFAIMLPFMLNLFVNINELSTVPKIIMYLIPFTHTYAAVDNLIFGNMTLYWGGLIYQILFFAVCMILAVKLFTSDKLFTASLSFGKKKNHTQE